MSEKRSRVFLGQVYTRQGKYGTFYSGRLERKEEPKPQPAFEDRMADDTIPFAPEFR